MADPSIDGLKARVFSIGYPSTGYTLGSPLSLTILQTNTIGSSVTTHVGNHDKLMFQFTATGSSSGSVLGGNDGTNFAVIGQQSFSGAGTVLIGLDFASIPKYIKVVSGSNSTGSFSGSLTCVVFGR